MATAAQILEQLQNRRKHDKSSLAYILNDLTGCGYSFACYYKRDELLQKLATALQDEKLLAKANRLNSFKDLV